MTDITFDALPLAEPLHRALRERNYTTPSPIQAQAIPLLLQGRDLLGCAQTGTGKTAGFALPILHALHERPRPIRPGTARTLVLTPTRELASQVAASFNAYGKHVRFRQTLIYGGVGQRPQVEAMRKGVDILVATPGRLLDLIDQGHLKLDGVEFFVLDEVDRMLDMGFLRDVKRIVSLISKERQSLFFSATLAPEIVKLAETILRDPARVTIAPQSTTAERVAQQVAFIEGAHKRQLLETLLRAEENGGRTIVFSRTKHGANKLAKSLTDAGFQADAIHGNKSQAQREKALDRFKKGIVPVLVATDVAARGVDIKDVGLVVNFDLPNEPESYVHRIGRTGRAGAEGRSVSFCSQDEYDYLREIEKVIRTSVPRWTDHEWHSATLEKDYHRGVRGSVPQKQRQSRQPSRPQGQGPKRSGNGQAPAAATSEKGSGWAERSRRRRRR